MPAYSTPPPGIVPGTMAYDMWQQSAGAYNQAEQDPAWQAAQQQKAAELNAYRGAQTASMGMMTSGPNSTVAADPSAAFQKFVQSGYTPQQALADGWATSGSGNKGWESMVGYQAPLNPQGMIGAPYAQQQIQQYQQAQQQTPTGGGANPFGSQPRNSPAATAYGQAPQRGGGIYQQLNTMLGGSGQNPFAQGGGFSQAPPRMQGSSGMPAGGYGQRQSGLGQSPGWQSFLSNLKPAAGF